VWPVLHDDHPDRPRSLSARASMREALAPVHRDRRPYEDPPAIERWLEAFESVLDPVVGLLDNLPAHLDPELVPEDMLATVSGWLGMPEAGHLTVEARRRLLDHAIEITKKRGTTAGLQLVLKLALPTVHLQVSHSGFVECDSDPDRVAAAEVPVVEVRAAAPLDSRQRETIERLVMDQLPVNVSYRLVVEP
jgi:phage tail-like protein